MPTYLGPSNDFPNLDKFADFWKTSRDHSKSEKILNIFSIGLGGMDMSFGINNIITKYCETYNKIYVFGVGERSGSVTTEDVLELLERINNCRDKLECYYIPVDIPIITRLGKETPETIRNAFETQFDDVDFSYYKSDPFIFYDDAGEKLSDTDEKFIKAKQDIGKIFKHWSNFFKNIPNGDLLIDNNAFIVGGGHAYYLNSNFEWMYWIPKLLNVVPRDRIFIKRSDTMIPFFSKDAVLKWSSFKLYNMLLFKQIFPSIDYSNKLFDTLGSVHDESKKRKMVLTVYRCLYMNLNTELPDFITNTCPPAAAGAAAGGAGASAGGRRATRRIRKSRRKSKRYGRK